MKHVFIITAFFGFWETASVRTIFATTDEKTAKKYCKKANKVMVRYKRYYEKLRNEFLYDIYKKNPRSKIDYCHVADRLDFASGRFSYERMELR